MKKQVIAICMVFAASAGMLNAQKSEQDPNGLSNNGSLGKRVFKAEPLQADKTESWDVKSIGQVTYAASNTADGSTNSYKHALRVTMNLLMVDSRAGNYQLVFYSEGEQIPYAVAHQDGATVIYYPVSVYSEIKGKLEQALAARKKVTIKVTEKTNGYREGVLNF